MEATNNIGKPILSGLVSKIRNIEGKPLRSAIRNVRPACTNKESPPRVSPSKVTFAAHDDIRVAHASPKSASLSDVETFWDPNPTLKVLNDGSHPDVMHSSIPTGSAFRASRFFEMEKVRNTSATLRSCLKGSQIRNIDGKIVGKDGKPMMPMRHETSNGGTVHEETVTVTKSLKDDTDRTFFEAWEDPNVGAMKTTYGNDAHESNENPNLASKRQGSFAHVLNNNPSSKSKFRSLLNSEKVENADVVLPLATFTAAQQRYANSLVGYFVGKNVAFPLVQNYVSNTWSKFGFQKVIKDEDGFFFFKFTSLSGLEQVTKVLVWVKMHKVPVVAYSEDGLSLIATQIGKPVMLDALLYK
ncbi:hypothetical protein Tco_0251261 [Tanacetum coccineum]